MDGAEEDPLEKIMNKMMPLGVETPMGDDITQLAQRIMDM